MTDKLRDFVSLYKKKKELPKTVADEMKRINRNERERIYYAKKYRK